MKPALARSSLPLLPAVALALLCACVENEEQIEVRPDGSVAVRVQAKGKPADLSDGYPVPLEGPWIADDDGARDWLREVGRDTGSAAVRERSAARGGDDDITLASRAEFRTVAGMPRFLASEAEPFRTAYLERTADLRIERKGARAVFVFERAYRARTFERHDVLTALKTDIDEDLFEKIEREETLTDVERSQVVDGGLNAMRRVPVAFAQDAVLSMYVQGDASLDPAGAERVVGRVREAIARVVTRERLERIAIGVLPPEGQEEVDGADEDLERMDEESRHALRESFAAALEQEKLTVEARHALRGELEWLLTARDHTDDIGDESFTVRVRMPGTVVGGNFDEIEEGAATWSFDGADLRDRDRILRVVSVVE